MKARDYDRLWASKWGDMQRYGPVHRHERRLMLGMLRGLEIGSMLEAGCGQGVVLERLGAALGVKELWGVDASGGAVEEARRRVPGARFEVLDIEKSKLDRGFDLVVCSNVVEHLEEDVRALEHLRGMSRRWCLITTLQGRMRAFEAGLGHVRNYAPGELRAKCGKAGLEVVRELNWGFPFFSPVYRSLLDTAGIERASEGRYGLSRRAVCSLLHALFLLNSSSRGDVLMILAKPRT